MEQVSSAKKGLKQGFERVTFIIKEGIAYKLNCIASIEDVFLKEVVNFALENYVTEWEKINGKIKNKRKK